MNNIFKILEETAKEYPKETLVSLVAITAMAFIANMGKSNE